MPDFDAYFSSSGAIDAVSRAVDAWNRINAAPTIITIIRDAVSLANQTMRVEYSGTGEEAASDAGRAGRQRCVLFGVTDHPTVTDTNIERGDRFVISQKQFEVISVINPPGEVQAFCEAIR